MAKAGYSTSTEGTVALAAATAKTVLAVIAPAQFGVDLKKLRIGFDGVTATAVDQVYGRSITAGFTAKKNYTVEPTGATAIDEWLLTPAGGLVIYDFPLGDTPDTAVSNLIGLRCNAPAAVNLRATLWFERC